MSKEKVVLLDFDGCLSNTWQMLIQLLLIVAGEEGINSQVELDEAMDVVKEKGTVMAGTWHLLQYLAIPLLKRPKILWRVNTIFNDLVESGSEYKGVSWDLFEDGLLAIRELTQQGYLVGLVSEHKHSRLIRFLKSRNVLEELNIGVFSSKRKEQLLAKLNRRFAPGQVFYVGDRTKDVKESKKAGVTPISIARGLNFRDDLEKVNPGKVIDNLDELIQLLGKLD